MRTTLDIPQDLIDETMRVTGAKTKSQLIRDALEAQIKRVKRQRLLSFKRKIDLEVDLNELRNRG